MNAYFCNAGWRDTGYPNPDNAFICDLIFAPTRGKAKALFFRKYNLYFSYGVEFTEIRASQVRADVDREPGLARTDDEYWNYVDYPVLTLRG